MQSYKSRLFEQKIQVDNQVQNFTMNVKEYVQDRNILLEDRWEVFVKAECGERKTWQANFNFNGKEIDWYDDLNKDKYSTVVLRDVVLVYEESNSGDVILEEAVNKLKGDVLERFLWSFVNDW